MLLSPGQQYTIFSRHPAARVSLRCKVGESSVPAGNLEVCVAYGKFSCSGYILPPHCSVGHKIIYVKEITARKVFF